MIPARKGETLEAKAGVVQTFSVLVCLGLFMLLHPGITSLAVALWCVYMCIERGDFLHAPL